MFGVHDNFGAAPGRPGPADRAAAADLHMPPGAGTVPWRRWRRRSPRPRAAAARDPSEPAPRARHAGDPDREAARSSSARPGRLSRPPGSASGAGLDRSACGAGSEGAIILRTPWQPRSPSAVRASGASRGRAASGRLPAPRGRRRAPGAHRAPGPARQEHAGKYGERAAESVRRLPGLGDGDLRRRSSERSWASSRAAPRRSSVGRASCARSGVLEVTAREHFSGLPLARHAAGRDPGGRDRDRGGGARSATVGAARAVRAQPRGAAGDRPGVRACCSGC